MKEVEMRAKMKVSWIEKFEGSDAEKLHFIAVGPNQGYPNDGTDEDNSYALWTPQGELTLTITNPVLYGKFKQGEKYYLEFIKSTE